MFTNNQKANQAKKEKTEVEFNFILEQILNLNTQKKGSKARSMKSVYKPRKKIKSNIESLDLYLYYSKPGHLKNKCYYKHLERVSDDF